MGVILSSYSWKLTAGVCTFFYGFIIQDFIACYCCAFNGERKVFRDPRRNKIYKSSAQNILFVT